MKREDKIKIEDRILSLMEKNNLAPWKCPWMFKDSDYGFQNKTPYRGVNAVMTSLYRASMGFNSTNWFTNNKINNLNGYFYDEAKKRYIKDKEGKYDTFYHIKKGARSIPIVKFNVFKEVDKETGEPILDERGKEILIPSIRVYNVFNGDDVVGYDSSKVEGSKETIANDTVSINSAIEFQNNILERYKNHPPVFNDGGSRAYYIPSLDSVHVPKIDDFKSWQEYACTLAHELSHSTGHEKRLKRNMEGNFGSNQYSKEELVAEFSAAMVLAKYGVDEIPVENSAAYIKNWSEHIRANQGILYDAIQQAQKASDLILGIRRVSEEEEEA